MRSQVVGRADDQSGFTLLELLTALTVVSVGVGVLVLLAGRVGDLYREAELRAAAADLALSKLAEVSRAPQAFRWQQGEQKDRLTVIPACEDPAADYGFISVPEEVIRRGKFRWRAFARPIESMPEVMELTVVVIWQVGGQERSFTLTAPIPAETTLRRAGAPAHAE